MKGVKLVAKDDNSNTSMNTKGRAKPPDYDFTAFIRRLFYRYFGGRDARVERQQEKV